MDKENLKAKICAIIDACHDPENKRRSYEESTDGSCKELVDTLHSTLDECLLYRRGSIKKVEKTPLMIMLLELSPESFRFFKTWVDSVHTCK